MLGLILIPILSAFFVGLIIWGLWPVLRPIVYWAAYAVGLVIGGVVILYVIPALYLKKLASAVYINVMAYYCAFAARRSISKKSQASS